MQTIHLLIRGKVQGVFYRASAKKIATELSLNGWIRNKVNGDVEALVTGDPGQLKKFSDWCRQGPKNAVVTELVETQNDVIQFDSFSIK